MPYIDWPPALGGFSLRVRIHQSKKNRRPVHAVRVGDGIGQDGRMNLKMDGGREVELDSVKNPHLDHGYAVTSHSSQGQTADRVLIHADTELGAKDLLNNRMAYVAVSRGAYDAQIFTNDREKLGAALGHDVSHSSAHALEMKLEQKQEQAVTPQREIAPKHEQGVRFWLGSLRTC